MKRGFFTVEPGLKELRPGAADKFLPCEAWRDFKPTRAELHKLNCAEQAKARYLKRSQKRRVAFLQKLKTTGEIATEQTGEIATDTKPRKRKQTCEIATDTKPKKGDPDRKKCHGLLPPGDRGGLSDGNIRLTPERQRNLEVVRLRVSKRVDCNLRPHVIEVPRVLILGPTDPSLVLRMAMLKKELEELTPCSLN